MQEPRELWMGALREVALAQEGVDAGGAEPWRSRTLCSAGVLADLCLRRQSRSLSGGHPQCPDPLALSPTAAIRFGRMPEAEKRKLVAGLTANEISCQNPQVADLKAFSKHIYNAYLKNFNMTKKKARGILTGKASSTPVSSFPGPAGWAVKHRGGCSWGDAARLPPAGSAPHTRPSCSRGALRVLPHCSAHRC